MIHIKAPEGYSEHIEKVSVFLAGSIEMGKAGRWQDRVAADLEDLDFLLLNPRRDDWDTRWDANSEHPQLREQVEWELRALEHCDLMIMYLEPGTKSPISLLEFGLYARSEPEKLIVCCPDGFWRQSNVLITSELYGVKCIETIEELVESTRNYILEQQKAAA